MDAFFLSLACSACVDCKTAAHHSSVQDAATFFVLTNCLAAYSVAGSGHPPSMQFVPLWPWQSRSYAVAAQDVLDYILAYLFVCAASFSCHNSHVHGWSTGATILQLQMVALQVVCCVKEADLCVRRLHKYLKGALWHLSSLELSRACVRTEAAGSVLPAPASV
jgi:hypothetical protein